MPVQAKLIFTVVSIAIAIAVLFIDPKADNAGASWLWRGGEKDWLRNAICRPNGSFRRFTKTGILTCFAIFLAALWLIT